VVNLAVVAPFNLSVRDGTSARVTGEVLSVTRRISKIFIMALELNEELSALNNVEWIRPRFWRGATSTALSYMIALRFHNLTKVVAGLMSPSKIDVDVVHVHWAQSLPLAYNYSGSVRLIVDLHGLLNLQQRPIGTFKDYALYILQRQVERRLLWALQDLDVEFIVPSTMFKDYLAERWGISAGKIRVIPDGIDLKAVPEYKEEETLALREKLGVGNRPLIAYAGNVTEYHGFYDLVIAYRLVKRIEDDVHLLLLVPQGLGGYVMKVLGHEAVVVENVPRRLVYNYLYVADALVLPHRAGTQFDYLYSNKLLDYVASGKPIVAYELAPVREMLKEYPLKVLVKPNSPRELARGILDALKLGGARVDGRAYLGEFDWEKIGEKLYEAYKSA